jgi:hypothetical protein
MVSSASSISLLGFSITLVQQQVLLIPLFHLFIPALFISFIETGFR